MSFILSEENRDKFLKLAIYLVAILLVIAGIVRTLIVPEDTEVLLDQILMNLFLATAFAFFAIAFFTAGLSEENNLIRAVCFFGALALTALSLFDINLLSVQTLVLTEYAIIGIFIAAGYLLIAIAIYVLRRAEK